MEDRFKGVLGVNFQQGRVLGFLCGERARGSEGCGEREKLGFEID